MHPSDPIAQQTLRREVRRLRLIVIMLSVVIVGLGWFCAGLLRTIDRDYATVLDRSVPALNQLRLLSNSALSTQRALLGGLAAPDPATRTRAIGQMRERLQTTRSRRESITDLQVFQDRPAFQARLARTGAGYEDAAVRALELLEADLVDDAHRLRADVVKPALDHYLTEIEIAARYVEDSSQNARDSVSEKIRNRSVLLVGVTSLPLVLFALVALTIVALMTAVVVILRRVGGEAGP
jgi:hypothetical protein